MATMSAELSKMPSEIFSTDSVNTAKAQIEEAGIRAESYEKLISAQQLLQGKFDNTANAIAGVEPEHLSVEAKSVYDTMMDSVGGRVKKKFKNQGLNAYNEGNYADAITWLLKAMNIGKQDSEILIFLAQAYEQQGETGITISGIEKIIDDFPGTEYADIAKTGCQWRCDRG